MRFSTGSCFQHSPYWAIKWIKIWIIWWPVLIRNGIAKVCLAALLRLASLMDWCCILLEHIWIVSKMRIQPWKGFLYQNIVDKCSDLSYLSCHQHQQKPKGISLGLRCSQKPPRWLDKYFWLLFHQFNSDFTVFGWCALILMVNSLFNCDQVFVTEDEIPVCISCSSL